VRSRAPWGQMVVATAVVMVLPAVPTSSPEPIPPSPPTPSPEPSPDPEPLLPLLASQLPIFPESTPAPPSHSKDDCKHGGWMDLGYQNQGQCIADANRGDDRRP
jgi:hypothetical protein